MLLKILNRYTSASIDQMSLHLSNDSHPQIKAQVFSALDQLQTIGWVHTLRTSYEDSDMWVMTAKGRAMLRETA